MEKVWLKSYRAEIPEFIQLDDMSLVDWFNQTCDKFATNRALTCHGVTLNFAEVSERCLKIAAGLQQLGVKHGDRVAIILPNSIQYPLTVFAAHMLGATVVNVNPLYTPAEIDYVIQNSEPKIIVVLDMFSAKLNGLLGKYGVEHIVVSKISDPYPFAKRALINFVLRYISKVNPKLSYAATSWRDLFHNSQQLTDKVTIKADDLAFIQYTGATTGHPKGAMLSHRNLVSNIRQVIGMIKPQMVPLDKQVVICALPLYHIFSLNANLMTFFFSGSENVMIPNARNIKDVVKTMNNTPFTIFNSLDSLYHKLLEQKEFINTPHPHYKFGICGGMATRKSVAEEWHLRTGLYPSNCYGLTEASPCVAMNYLDDDFNGSVGYPIPSTEIDIRDVETGVSLPQGETGVILLRGPQIMQGYWRNPEQTAKAISADGWFNTGDVGYFDELGRLFISSRVTEMIIVSGFNVYPAEVERVIDEIPQVQEIAVVGYPEENTGESVHAYIVFRGNEYLTKDDINAYCRKKLTKYKIPHHYHFVTELPKTPVGKIDKKALREEYISKVGI